MPRPPTNVVAALERMETQLMHMKICVNESRWDDARRWHGIIESSTQQLYENRELYPEDRYNPG